MKKRALSAILVLAALLSQVGFAKDYSNYPQRFWDVGKDYWAYEQISELADKNVLNGYGDGSFRPENTVLRGEWAKIMVLVAGLKADDKSVRFKDLAGHWANAYVNAAQDYLAAYTDGSFKPEKTAAREDVTVSMVKLKGYDVSKPDYTYIAGFKDVTSISNDLKKYVAVAVEKGLITGFEDNTFRGQDTLTRAEASTLLWRAFRYGSDDKVAAAEQEYAETPTAPIQTPEPSSSPSASPEPSKKQEENLENNKNSAAQLTPSEERETVQKPYIIETLKTAELKREFTDYTYDENNIYYLSEKTVYQLNPHSGKAKSIYDTSELRLQKKQMKERQIVRTISTTDKSNEEKLAEEVDTLENSEQPENGRDMAELVEIQQEEVVVKEYSSYVPTQIIYDKYNDRLILNGYYKDIEEIFQEPQSDARYYAAYDITNDALYMELGEPYSQYGIIKFETFLSEDKALISNCKQFADSGAAMLIDTNRMCSVKTIGYYAGYWTTENYLFAASDNYNGKYFDSLCQYDFSAGKFYNIFDFPNYSCAGVNGENIYYWNIYSDSKKFCKLNLISGKVEELDINANSENCEIEDMTPISCGSVWKNLIPVSDNCFIFYDAAAKAFRRISKR